MFVVTVGAFPLLSTARVGSGRVTVLYFLPASVPNVAGEGQVISGASSSKKKLKIKVNFGAKNHFESPVV